MATNKLSAKFCEHAPQGSHFDGDGLYLAVEPNNKKYWRMVCYLHGKRILVSIGSYKKIDLAQAREKRKAVQKLISAGINPNQYKKDQKQNQLIKAEQKAVDDGFSFEQFARALHASKDGKTTDEYRNKMLSLMEKHIFPVVGRKNIMDIEGAEWLALFKSIGEKTNHGRKMTYLSLKLCQWCSEIYDFAHVVKKDFFKNPCRVVIKYLPKHKTKHMKRISFKELPKFVKDLKEYGGYPITKSAIWLMLYTGVRQKSVRYCIKKDFDFENTIWHRQPEKVNEADKTEENILDLPLPLQAVKILEGLKEYTAQGSDGLMFPSPYDPNDRMSEATIGKALKLMEYEMVGHGLRGLVNTSLHELGYKPHVIEAQLGHKQPQIKAAYNDSTFFEERKVMMQEWANYLDSLLEQK